MKREGKREVKINRVKQSWVKVVREERVKGEV